MGENAGEGKPRRSISSAKRSRDQTKCPVIQGNILGNSTDKNICYECIGQLECEKYLRESCYHRIECSTANALTALMRK